MMLVLWLLNYLTVAFAFLSVHPKGQPSKIDGDVGEKLILTPYIEKGQIAKARKLARVPPFTENIVSYSGYLTVNKSCDSNMFFWFFPSEDQNPKAPVAVWLQGGPGSTSLYGLFIELGAYELTPQNKVINRKYSWSRSASYIFIDNPVGTGYSYTGQGCYARNQEDVGRDLLNAVKQILKMFPEYISNPFFVTGESYAGKYVPALSYAIHKDVDPQLKINLQGLAIGNGLVDPVNQLYYSDYLLQLGLLDFKEAGIMRMYESNCRAMISREDWLGAFNCFENLLNGDTIVSSTYFRNITGFEYYYNFLYSHGQPEGELTTFITSSVARKSIHVGNAEWHTDQTVERNLEEDVMKSVRPWLEELLEHYRVLIYNGQLDIIVAYPLTEHYLKKLQWSAAEAYKTAPRRVWRVDNDVAGYAKTAGKLTEVLVRNAGHMVPRDQPKWAFDLINRFFAKKPFQ